MKLIYTLILLVLVCAPVSAVAETPPPLVLTWGGDILNRPMGVAVGSDGYVYVSDTGHGRICKFGTTGTLVSTISSSGWRVAINPKGDVYVADTGNSQIEQFASNGTLIRTWGSQGSGRGQFQSPIGIALDAEGNVYVVEDENARVQKFDPSGNFLLQWSVPPNPWGIAIDNNDHVYITIAYSGDPNVCMFDNTGHRMGNFGPVIAQGVAVDNDGNVYAADVFNTRIVKFNAARTLLVAWGVCNTGSGAPQCRDVAVSASGIVYVVNSECNTVQVYGNMATPVKVSTWGHLKSFYR